MTDNAPKCPKCPRDLVFVEDAPMETEATASQIVVPLGSEIHRCEEHGLWRVHIDGRIEPYLERQGVDDAGD